MKSCLMAFLFILPALYLGAAEPPGENIAFAARFSTTPPMQGDSFKALTDGHPGSAVNFEVGSTGNGTLTATFPHPRQVTAVRLYQSSDLYWSAELAVEGDADGDGRFEHHLATWRDAKPKDWVEATWEPVSLKSLRVRSLNGTSKGRRAHPSIGEIAIVGPVLPDDLATMIAGNAMIHRLPLATPTPSEIMLNEDNQPLLILAGSAVADSPPVAHLREMLTQAGVKTILAEDPKQVLDGPGHVLCLGNMTDNPLLETLYWNRYTFADALTPGSGRFLLQSVFSPYPLDPGRHVIVLGCSDATGLNEGVTVLLARLAAGRFPATVVSGPDAPLDAAREAALGNAPLDPTFVAFTTNANHYLQTGSTPYAERAVATMRTMAAMYAPGGERHTPVGSSTHRKMPWPEETSSWEILCAWDAFEEYPGIDADLRLAFTNAMLQFTRDLVSHVSGYGALGRNDLVTWNHTTFPLLGIHFGARYFQRHYNLPDMPPMLRKAEACFLAQARSWKPQEDADSYLTLTTEHARTYCLAEGHMDYFRDGLMAAYADHVIGFCDNRGYAAGFGDSGISVRPNLLTKTLPLALWATRNGEYRWLMEHLSDTPWNDPHGTDVPPVEPTRLLGVTVFPMDPQVYAWTQSQPSYNEPLVKAEVSAQEAFDKISFRENWSPGGQYLLLDGLARGKHLHYDANAIIAFVEGGERWLLDSDYLVRNTTEHCMVTILREGRADTLVPSMSGLLSHVDLPTFGYTRTITRGYSGCDWERQIGWLRGEWFLVRDTITAREPGSYDIEITWKTIDEAGNQRVDENGTFTAVRGLGARRTVDCQRIDDPEAESGQALLLDQATSQVAFGVDLPPGDYRFDVVARGVDGSSDSIWVSVDDAKKLPFHLAKDRYAAAAGDHTLAQAPPQIRLLDDRANHCISVSLREKPPVRISHFVLTDEDGRRHLFSPQDLTPPPPPPREALRSLSIKPLEPIPAWVTNHQRKGITVPVSILHQRGQGTLVAGDSRVYTSVLYVDRAEKRRDLAITQDADGLIHLSGSAPALLAPGSLATPLLQADVEVALLSPTHLALGSLRHLTMPGLQVTASAPLDVELDLHSGNALLVARETTTLQATGNPTKQVPPGTHRLALLSREDAATLRRWIEARLDKAPPATATSTAAPGTGQTTKQADPVWQAFAPGAPIRSLKVADLQDGAGNSLLVCRGSALHCLDPQGRTRWSFNANSTMTDAAWGNLRDDGPGLEILAGSSDTWLYLLRADGTMIDKHQVTGIPWARSFGERPFAVCHVAVGDITGNERDDILVTMTNFDLQALAADWSRLWRFDHAKHGSTSLRLEDTDFDGQQDTILLGDRYGSSLAVDFRGRVVHQRYTSIGDVVCSIADLTGDRTASVLTGSSTGDLVATRLADRSSRLWSFNNYGFPVNALATADLTGDGVKETLVASGTGYLHAVDRDGNTRWQTRLGYGVNAVVTLGEGHEMRIAAADESGQLYLLDRNGNITRTWHSDSPARLLLPLVEPDKQLLLTTLADGRLLALDL